MIKFLLFIIVVAGGVFGTIFFFFRESPVFASMFPQLVTVSPADTAEQIAVSTLLNMQTRGEKLNLEAQVLEQIYQNAVERKFQAGAIDEGNGELVILWKSYITAEEGRVASRVLGPNDANGDNLITRDEWRGTKAAFGRLDTNDDDIISRAEIWDTKKYDKAKDFKTMDKNADGKINQQEFFASFAGKGSEFIKSMDANGNGFFEDGELANAKITHLR